MVTINKSDRMSIANTAVKVLPEMYSNVNTLSDDSKCAFISILTEYLYAINARHGLEHIFYYYIVANDLLDYYGDTEPMLYFLKDLFDVRKLLGTSYCLPVTKRAVNKIFSKEEFHILCERLGIAESRIAMLNNASKRDNEPDKYSGIKLNPELSEYFDRYDLGIIRRLVAEIGEDTAIDCYAYTGKHVISYGLMLPSEIITISELRRRVSDSVHNFELRFMNALVNAYREDCIWVRDGEPDDKYVKLCVS